MTLPTRVALTITRAAQSASCTANLTSPAQLGPRLIKPTIQERRRGKQMRDNFEPICRSGLRCA